MISSSYRSDQWKLTKVLKKSDIFTRKPFLKLLGKGVMIERSNLFKLGFFSAFLFSGVSHWLLSFSNNFLFLHIVCVLSFTLPLFFIPVGNTKCFQMDRFRVFGASPITTSSWRFQLALVCYAPFNARNIVMSQYHKIIYDKILLHSCFHWFWKNLHQHHLQFWKVTNRDLLTL